MSAFNTQSLINWDYALADYNGFLLEKSSNSGSTWTSSLSCSAATTSYVDNNVTWGDTRWYRVSALNSVGSSTPSALFELFIHSPGVDTPVLAGAQYLFETQSAMSWTYSGSSQGGCDYFILERSIDSGSSWPYSASINPTSTSYNDFSVSYASNYWYRIKAHCTFGLYGPYSDTASVFIFYPPSSCVSPDFGPSVQAGYIGYGSASYYAYNYGVRLNFTNSVISQSVSLWARSQDFDTYVTLVDPDGGVVGISRNGFTPDGDFNGDGDTALSAILTKSGSYTVEVASQNNGLGRYALYVSPGPKLETSWSAAGETADVVYISSSNYIVIGESGPNLVFYDITNQTTNKIVYSNGVQGAAYSPTQDKVYAWVYYQTAGKYTASIDEYDNTGSFLQSNFFYRDPISQSSVPPTIDFNGYLSYDSFNDRILFARYNYTAVANITIWDCATRTVLATLSSSAYQNFSGFWMSCYSAVNNSYYLATQGMNPMVKVDASSFAMSNTAQSAKIVVTYIPSNGTMMIRGTTDTLKIYDPVSDTIVHTQTGVPGFGLFEEGADDTCTDSYIAAVDDQNNPNSAGIVVIDKNTYAEKNFLQFTNEDSDPPNGAGWYQYSITFVPSSSRVYSAMQEFDFNTGRLYSIGTSTATAPVLAPFTASNFPFTASCMTYSGSFLITSSNPGPTDWMGRAYPSYITSTDDLNFRTMVVSDNEYLLDGTFQHNRHNWFFNFDGTVRYNDYTESYIHTWPGKNAVFCGGKYFMMSDGLNHQTFLDEPMTASAMLMFDRTGSLLSTIPLTYGGMDWSTDGKNVWVFEHDGTTLWLEQLTGSDGSILNTQNIYDGGFIAMNVSATASFSTSIDNGYYGGAIVSFTDGNTNWSFVNNAISGSTESGSGDLLTAVQDGFYAGNGYFLSMADDGITPYGGWAGSMAYCQLTNTVFIGAFGAAPDYQPLILETDSHLNVIYTYDLSEFTGSVFAVDDIKYNRKNHTLELLNYWSNPAGAVLVLDPIAHTVVCDIYPISEIPLGASAGRSIAVEPYSGDLYWPQRFDGDVNAYTGSVKRYHV